MKTLLTIFVLLFSTLMISSNSYAEWKFISVTTEDAKYYIDTDRITLRNELIYYWELTDYADEGGYGYLSDVTQVVLDCNLKRYKNLQITNYKDAMGTGRITGSGEISEKWTYALPNTSKEMVTDFICKLMNK